MRGWRERTDDDEWRLSDGSFALSADLDDHELELALLAAAQKSAARMGAEWYAAEFARRDEEDRQQRERAELWETSADALESPVVPDTSLVDAWVEDSVVGGTPVGLGIASPTPPPEPAIRHPEVPRPPGQEPAPSPKRRRRGRKMEQARTPSRAISVSEWARMTPAARRLYVFDEPPRAT